MASAEFLGRVAADLQQGQDQRIEFMPHRQSGEGDGIGAAGAADDEGRLARVLAGAIKGDFVGLRGNVFQQGQHLPRLVAVINGSDQFDRLNDTFEIGFQLRFDGVVQHGAGLRK